MPDNPSVTAGRLFGCLVEVLRERPADLAYFSKTGASFESWILWSWVARASRHQGLQVRPEPVYTSHGLQEASTYARGDLMAVGDDGSRVWVELALVHDWTAAKWYAEDGELAMDRRRLARNAGRGFDLLKVIIVASSKDVITPDGRLEPLRRSGCWAEQPTFFEAIPLLPAGRIFITGWRMAKVATV